MLLACRVAITSDGKIKRKTTFFGAGDLIILGYNSPESPLFVLAGQDELKTTIFDTLSLLRLPYK